MEFKRGGSIRELSRAQKYSLVVQAWRDCRGKHLLEVKLRHYRVLRQPTIA
jgi:hypothetical protein